EGVDVMSGVIRLAPAGHIDRELAQVCPHHLEQELQLVSLLGVLGDSQPDGDRRSHRPEKAACSGNHSQSAVSSSRRAASTARAA
ncbi:hypothetical protein, partial [Leucobacter sp. M11]|uniref:hypothetical protein n=1 Tax=Leucobacter sp. M11 TaxID=2993565 RepID=UPI002D80DB6A